MFPSNKKIMRNVQKVVIVLTDGASTNKVNTQKQANLLKSKGGMILYFYFVVLAS